MASWDRLKASFFALVGAADSRAPYGGIYGGTVVAQSGDAVDLRMDDETIPGFSALPVHVGLPGSRVNFLGGRMFVMFENRDPAKPRAILWDAGAGSTVTLLTLGGRDASEALVLGTSYRAAEDALVSGLASAVGTLIGAATTGSLLPLQPGLLAAKAALQAFQSSAQAKGAFLSKVVRTI